MEEESSIMSKGDTSFELSDSSTINIDTDTADYFNGIFYHIIPSPNGTNIMFYNKPLFNNVIQVLRNEFITPEESVKFALTTHVDGHKKCNIHVDMEQMTFSVTGPGHTYWLNVNFRKMALAMYKNFVSDTDASLSVVHDNRTSTPAMSVSDDEEYFDLDNMDAEQSDVENNRVVSRISQISDIMEKIKTLQKQLSDLTGQVNKLVQETCTANIGQSINMTSSPQSNGTVLQKSMEQVIISDTESVSLLPQSSVVSQPTQPDKRGKKKNKTKRKSRASQSNTEQQPHSQPVTKEVPQPGIPPDNPCNNTLIIGDSVLHGINLKGLKSNVHKHSVSGANIDTILCDIRRFDLKTFSSIIIYVGGNDVSNGSDIELFEEKYDHLLNYIKQQNSICKVILCNLCPRTDVDDFELCELNGIIMSLAKEYGHTGADMYSAFHEKDGNVCERFYQNDWIHVNSSGMKRFMRVLHDIEHIVEDFDQCCYPKKTVIRSNIPRYSYGQMRRFTRDGGNCSQRRGQSQRSDNATTKCYKCGETNHNTGSCRHKKQLRCYCCQLYGHKRNTCENEK